MNKIMHIWLALIGVIFIAGCSPSTSKTAPTGKAAETWKFWESLNQAATAGIGTESLVGGSQPPNVEPALLVAIMSDVSNGEIARSKAITSLPVLNVDPDLSNYAVKQAKARLELAEALQGYVTLSKQADRVIDPKAFGVGLLLNLLMRSNEKEDGMVWRALLDQGRETASSIQSLKEPAMLVETKFQSVRKRFVELQTDEMDLRIKLAQRYGKEFPPQTTYRAAAAAAKPKPKPPTESQIAESLVGRRVQKQFDEWSFSNLNSFLSLKILNTTQIDDNQVQFIIQTDQKGIWLGTQRSLKLKIKYQVAATRWAMTELIWLDQ